MAALPPAVAAVRVAVRATLSSVPRAALVMVACSGGPDSLALASAVQFLAPRLGLKHGLVTVDHNMQPGSAARASAVATWAREVGFAPVRAVAVDLAGRAGGPEAAARGARYEALAAAASDEGAAAVLLGHTREDQAETVLLALARGSGPRGIAGMPARRRVHGVEFLRPLLAVARATTRAACEEVALEYWDDPQNTDPAFARARVRAALPILIEALGPDVVANLARTAELVAADVAVLDVAAERATTAARVDGRELSVCVLTGLAPAIRSRVLHAWAKRVGAGGAALSHRHVTALDALVTCWHGQGPVALPGGVQVLRERGRLVAMTWSEGVVPGRRR